MDEYTGIIDQPAGLAPLNMKRTRWQNAISHAMYKEIEDAMDRAAADPQVKVLVISGNGRSFSSGHDTIGGSPEGAPVLSDGVPAEELRKKYNTEKEMWRAY